MFTLFCPGKKSTLMQKNPSQELKDLIADSREAIATLDNYALTNEDQQKLNTFKTLEKNNKLSANDSIRYKIDIELNHLRLSHLASFISYLKAQVTQLEIKCLCLNRSLHRKTPEKAALNEIRKKSKETKALCQSYLEKIKNSNLDGFSLKRDLEPLKNSFNAYLDFCATQILPSEESRPMARL